MKYISYLFFAIVAWLFIQAVQPQKAPVEKRRVDIIHSDIFTFNEKVATNATRLIGNVQLSHNQAMMYCDSAYQFNDSNKFEAFGRVHIVQGDSLHLYGDKMNYNGDMRLAKFFGNVKLVDKSITLTTEELEFDLATNVGSYTNHGKVVDTSNVLTSIIGKYYSNQDLFYFKDSVVVTNKEFVLNADRLKYNSKTERVFLDGPTTIVGTKDGGTLYSEDGWYDTRKNIAELYKGSKISNKGQILQGDTLFYNKANGSGKAHHNVILTDTTNKVKVTGHFGVYNEKTKIAFVTDSAIFMHFGEKDTLFMHSDTLKSIPDTIVSNKLMKSDTIKINKLTSSDTTKTNDAKFFLAFHRVRFYKSDLAGQCDSLSYQTKDSIIRMFQSPVLWDKTSQMSADKIEYISKKIDPDYARLENNAFIIAQEDTTKFNQISGKTIVGQIFDSKLRNIEVNGNAQTIYFLKDKNHYTGANSLQSSKIHAFLKENKMDSIIFFPKPEGRTIPLKELTPDDSHLKGFLWRESEKPINQFDLYPIDEKRKKIADPKAKPAKKSIL